jgi:hypothetical protein
MQDNHPLLLRERARLRGANGHAAVLGLQAVHADRSLLRGQGALGVPRSSLLQQQRLWQWLLR